MSLLTLFTRNTGWVTTDQRIFDPESIGATLSVIEQAEQLTQLVADQEATVAQAERAGYEAGWAKGVDEAREAGRQASAAALITLEQRYASEETRLLESASSLALEIVRRIAAEVAPAEWLLALASTAAAELAEPTRIVLRVHPSQVDAVRRLWLGKGESPLRDVLGDDSLTQDACRLETPRGSVDVDLSTQLQQIEQLLADTP